MDCEPNPVKCWSTPHVICSERRGEWRFSRQLKLQTRTEPQLPRVASQNMLVAGMVFPNSVHVEPKIQTPSSQHQGKLAKQKALGPSDDHVCVCSIVRTPRPPSNFGLLRLFQRVLGRSPYFNTHAYYINVSSNPLLVRTFLHPIEKNGETCPAAGRAEGRARLDDLAVPRSAKRRAAEPNHPWPALARWKSPEHRGIGSLDQGSTRVPHLDPQPCTLGIAYYQGLSG